MCWAWKQSDPLLHLHRGWRRGPPARSCPTTPMRFPCAREAKAIFQAACQKLARNMIYQGMRKRLRGGTGKEGTCNSDRKICPVVYSKGQIDVSELHPLICVISVCKQNAFELPGNFLLTLRRCRLFTFDCCWTPHKMAHCPHFGHVTRS